MSTFLDLETDRWHDPEENRDFVDWMTIKGRGGWVHIGRENLIRGGIRRVDPGAGISFKAIHLDAVIDALVRLRSSLPNGNTPTEHEPK